MSHKKKVHKYYDIKQVLSYGAILNIIIGARGLGKTYGFVVYSVRRALETGEQFIYVRRYREELATSRATFFAAIEHNFPDHEFKTQGMYAYARRVSVRREDETEEEFVKRGNNNEWVVIGYFVALSVAQGMKSVSFPKVYRIIFDEFILEEGNTSYLPKEARALINFYMTVDRNQDRVKMYLLANAVSMMNPYFIEYDIDSSKLPEISTHHKGFMLIHLPKSEEFQASVMKTRLGAFINGTEYAEYAVANTFSDGHEGMLGMKPPRAIYRFSIETRKGTFSVWYDSKAQHWYVQAKRPKVENIYTFVAENMSEEKTLVTFSDKLMSYLRTAYRHARLFSDSPKTRNAFVEVFRR